MTAAAPYSSASSVRAAAGLFALAVAPVLLVYLFWDTALLFLPDDAYYYFEIARNMAGGYGSTFDRINPTNGYHPLWCLLLVPLALAVTSATGFVRAALFAQGALVWLGLCLALLAVAPRPSRRVALVSGAAAILLLWNFYVSKAVINGLESAVTFAATAALLFAFARAADRPEPISIRRAAGLGALAALAVLGRLDSVCLVAAVVIVWVARMRRTRTRTPGPVLAFAAVPALTLLVYVLLNEYWFGLWLPVSGYVKLVVRPTGTSPTAVALWIASLAVVTAATRFGLGGRTDLRRGGDAALVASAVFVALLQSQALLYRGVVVPEIWYLAPHVLWLFLVASAAADAFAGRHALARPLGAAAALLAAVAVAVSWNIRLQRSSYDAYLAARDAAEWMNAPAVQVAVTA